MFVCVFFTTILYKYSVFVNVKLPELLPKEINCIERENIDKNESERKNDTKKRKDDKRGGGEV